MGNVIKSLSINCQENCPFFWFIKKPENSKLKSSNLKNLILNESLITPYTTPEKTNIPSTTRLIPLRMSKIFELDFLNSSGYSKTHDDRQKNRISLKDFEILKLIGTGGFGKVFLVKRKFEDTQLYAMKICQKSTIIQKNQVNYILTEREILSTHSHPFISKLCYSFQDNDKLYLITEFMSGGNLMHKLTTYGRLNEKLAKIYACEIVLALEYLHKNNIIFRDLKPDNILLDEERHIKLTDFGLSKILSSRQSHKITFSICGTLPYLAPEISKGKGYSHEVDWWSFGIVLYEMVTGEFPFKKEKKTKKIITRFNRQKMDKMHIEEDTISLISGLLSEEFTERLNSAEEIKNHKYFEDINWDDVYYKRYVIKEDFDNLIRANKPNESTDNMESLFEEQYLNNKAEVEILNEKTNEDDNYSHKEGSIFSNFSFSPQERFIL